jgi:DegV family protein with EDD domain
MKPFTIVVDTSCDLPPEYVKEHGIQVIPIPFTLDGEDHEQGYWQKISAASFYNSLKDGGKATTSQINPDTFVKSFAEYAERGEDVLYILLSGGLSGTYQSAQLALEEVREAYPGCKVFPIDSIGATSANDLLTIMAVKKREEGLSAEETAAWLEEKKHRIMGFFTVDDLMFLHRGGRLSKLSAVGGSLLNIKPILNLQPDGTLALKKKVRGRTAALKALVSLLMQNMDWSGTLNTVYITHTNCEDDAQKLAELLKTTAGVRQITIVMMGPVIGAHVGPGTVTLIFEANKTRNEYESELKQEKRK